MGTGRSGSEQVEVNKNREAFPGKLLRVDWAQAGPALWGPGDRATEVLVSRGLCVRL